MRNVVAQLSALSFVVLCVAASAVGIFFFPTMVTILFDLIGLNTEAPLSNFVGWSLLISATVGLVFPTAALMSARGDFDSIPNDENSSAAFTDEGASAASPYGRCRTPRVPVIASDCPRRHESMTKSWRSTVSERRSLAM